MSIQIMRGTSDKIKASTIVPKAGQPLYATDTHELFVGDGSTQAKDLTGIVGEATNALQSDVATLKTNITALQSDTATLTSDTTTLKSDVATLKSDDTVLKSDMTNVKSDVTTLKTTDSKLKAKQSASDSKNYVLSGDLNWLKLPNNTIPTFEVNTSTGELIIKINGEDMPAEEIIETTSVSCSSVGLSSGDKIVGFGSIQEYCDGLDDDIFYAVFANDTMNAQKGNVSDLGVNTSDDLVSWFETMYSKMSQNEESSTDNIVVTDKAFYNMYNSGPDNMPKFFTYGTLLNICFNIETDLQLKFPTDALDDTAVSTLDDVLVLLDCDNFTSTAICDIHPYVNSLIQCICDRIDGGEDNRTLVGIYCQTDVYSDICDYIVNAIETKVGKSVDHDILPIGATYSEITSSFDASNRYMIFNSNIDEEQLRIDFVVGLMGNITTGDFSGVLFMDDSMNSFNTTYLSLLNRSELSGVNLYTYGQINKCKQILYNALTSNINKKSVLVLNSIDLLRQIERVTDFSQAFQYVHKVLIGVELLIPYMIVKNKLSTSTLSIDYDSGDLSTVRNFTDDLESEDKLVDVNDISVEVSVRKRTVKQPTVTTIKTITVKQSKSY